MKNLVDLSHSLSKFVVCAEGNVSERTLHGFNIKASGAWLSNLSEEEIVACDFDGNSLDKIKKKPSMEFGMHSWILKNSDCNIVAHTHPINTLKILCTQNIKEFSNIRLFPEHVVFNGEASCIVSYANPGLQLQVNLEKAANKFIQNTNRFPSLFLLQNHGIIVIGKTYTECLVATEICEKAAEIYFGSKLLDNINLIGLSKEDILHILNDKNEIYRKKQLL